MRRLVLILLALCCMGCALYRLTVKEADCGWSCGPGLHCLRVREPKWPHVGYICTDIETIIVPISPPPPSSPAPPAEHE